MNINISKITGYASNAPIICVKQQGTGKTLYRQENPGRDRMTFNLIPGKWVTNQKLTKLSKPVVYITPPIAEPEFKRNIKPHKFRKADNPAKVTINFKHKDYNDIKVDPEIAAKGIYTVAFINDHEICHNFYGKKNKELDPKGYYASETKCDIGACKIMLQNGFNPSQCILAVDHGLSELENAVERKMKVVEWVNRVHADNESFQMNNKTVGSYDKDKKQKLKSLQDTLMNTLESFDVGERVYAIKDGTAIDEAGGSEYHFKKDEDLGTVDISNYGAAGSGKLSTSRDLIVKVSEVRSGKGGKPGTGAKSGSGFGIGDKDIAGMDLEHGAGLLMKWFFIALLIYLGVEGLKLVFGKK